MNTWLSRLGVLVFFLYAGGILSLLLGQELSWDMANYHFYNPYALLNTRSNSDFWPVSFIHQYFNPTADLFSYYLIRHFSAYTVVFVMGAFHGLNLWLLYLIARLFISSRYAIYIAGLLAILGIASPLILAGMGGFSHDNTASIFVLAFVYLSIKTVQDFSKTGQLAVMRIGLAGVCLGIAMGIKLTSGSYLLGGLFAGLLLPVPYLTRFKFCVYLGLAVILGWVLTSGYWMLLLWQQFHNPFFPFFNAIFQSTSFPAINFNYEVFFPPTWWDKLIYPWQFSWHGTKVDGFFTDLRFVIVYMLFMLLALRWLCCRRMKSMPIANVWLFVFVVVSYVAWLNYFAIIRYLAPIAMLAPLVIYLQVSALFQDHYFRLAVLAAILVLFAVTVKFSYIIRVGYYHPTFFNVQLPLAAQDARPAMVLVAYPAYALDLEPKPQSYLIPFFPKDWRFVGVPFSKQKLGDLQFKEFTKMSHMIAATTNPIYLLSSDTIMPRFIVEAKHFGLVANGDCLTIASDRQVISVTKTMLCPMLYRSLSSL